jgi:hypothetical protein
MAGLDVVILDIVGEKVWHQLTYHESIGNRIGFA